MAEGPKLLDADTLIDEILAKKGPHVYQDGLSEENWEEELEQIPLFMTKSPDAGNVEKSPALSALQALKYEQSSPESRAAAYKDEGNEQFRLKHYRQAIEEYTAGLREGMAKEGVAKEGVGVALRAVLYTNRAAAHFYLGNLRSCLNDVQEAKKIKPDHLKAVHRGAMVCIKLGRFGEALEWCDHGLRVDPEHSKLKELRSQAVREKKRGGRDQRKKAGQEQAKARAEEVERNKLLEAIQSRGIHLASSVSLDGGNVETPHLVLDGDHPTGDKVHFDPQDRLVWPVLFLYPEHGQTDLISAFHEDQRFNDHLEVMFGDRDHPSWDPRGVYTPTTLKVYFEDSFGGGFVAVEPTMTLQEALSSQGYTVGAGTPSFFILSSNSPFTQHFLQKT